MSTHPRHRLRRWRASWRDTLLLVRQFRAAVLVFGSAVLLGGLLYHHLAGRAAEPTTSLIEAIYIVLTLAFLQPASIFPQAWYLQVFYFVMPVIGISALAQGLADFGVLLFNRKARSKEWEMAVASTLSGHVILVGLGHLGFHVIEKLYELDQDLVVVELDPQANLLSTVRGMGIPVLEGDATRETTLQAAGVARARALVLCTQNDNLNLQMAVKARGLNPTIDVVVRIFDEDFAEALQQQFGFRALSATGMAAPVFAAAAAGVDVTRPITVEGQALSLARMTVGQRSTLCDMPVGEVEQRFDVSVVLWCRDEQTELHPPAEQCLSAGDVLAVLGGPEGINTLVHANH